MHIKLTVNKNLYQVSRTTPLPLSDSKLQNLERLARLLRDALVVINFNNEILKTNIKITLIKLNIKATLEVVLKYLKL